MIAHPSSQQQYISRTASTTALRQHITHKHNTKTKTNIAPSPPAPPPAAYRQTDRQAGRQTTVCVSLFIVSSNLSCCCCVNVYLRRAQTNRKEAPCHRSFFKLVSIQFNLIRRRRRRRRRSNKGLTMTCELSRGG